MYETETYQKKYMPLIIKKVDRYFEQIFVHTGQNYDYELNIMCC